MLETLIVLLFILQCCHLVIQCGMTRWQGMRKTMERMVIIIIIIIQGEITSRLNLGCAYYHSVQNLLSSCLLSQKTKMEIYRILHGWYFIHYIEGRIHIEDIENAEDIGPSGDELTESWRKLHNEELHNFYSFPNTIVKQNEMSSACSMNGRKE
jgi:hypothetical protein